MNDRTLQVALDAAERGEPVTVTLDAATLETLSRFWAGRKRAWRQWHGDAESLAPGYGVPAALGCVLWLAAGDATALAQPKIDAAETLAEAER